MKHAGPEALKAVADVLTTLRGVAGLKEKKLGVFYRGATAFLHFHEDPAGIFADLRSASDWQRFPVNTRSERAALVREVRARLRT